jgi:hypothetical protein
MQARSKKELLRAQPCNTIKQSTWLLSAQQYPQGTKEADKDASKKQEGVVEGTTVQQLRAPERNARHSVSAVLRRNNSAPLSLCVGA